MKNWMAQQKNGKICVSFSPGPLRVESIFSKMQGTVNVHAHVHSNNFKAYVVPKQCYILRNLINYGSSEIYKSIKGTIVCYLMARSSWVMHLLHQLWWTSSSYGKFTWTKKTNKLICLCREQLWERNPSTVNNVRAVRKRCAVLESRAVATDNQTSKH